MTKPVYIINGFLESGKTEFITFTLGQPYFQIKGRTLLILCEEGENEYDPALLKKSRTDVVMIEEEEEFNPNHLIELEKQYKPARIIIEYNGMRNFKNMKLPWYWKVEQQIREEGLLDILSEAGFKMRQPGCSACLAMNDDKVPAGKYAVSTSNRNFEGRQGPGARTILAGPLVAAAAAINGKITAP